MSRGFWGSLPWPIIGLAPMDGVTDAAFRYVIAHYSKPDIIITEFTSVEGICAGAVRTLVAFLYDESERPVVAQVFGSTPEAFYKSAFVVAELGFDGIDINMGCPATNVASKGSGAGLIQTPRLAQEIIRQTKKACQDWHDGKKIETVGLPETIVEYIHKNRRSHSQRPLLPVSVKTRIGYHTPIVEEWMKYLLEVEPVNITLHGRTLKQMYTGNADWEAIARAAALVHQTSTTIIGNGDVKTVAEAHEKIRQFDVDGVFIGRASFGNPWLFKGINVSSEERLRVALFHAQYYEKIFGNRLFLPMRKHLAWYCRGFPNASEVRQKLMMAQSAQDVKMIIDEVLPNFCNGLERSLV